MKENFNDLGKIINENDSEDENEIDIYSQHNRNSRDNDIKSKNSKKSNKKGRSTFKSNNNLQEIDDFLIVLDNTEEYKKMILSQAKNKIRRAIKKIKEAKNNNKILYDPTSAKKYIINPEKNKFIPYFNFLIYLLLYLDIIISPYEYFVNYNKKTKLIRIILFDFIFSSEIVLTIFTSYYDTINKYYVTDIKKIFYNYLWNGFIPNVIYVFPFSLIHPNLEIIRLIKIYRYPYLNNKTKSFLFLFLSFIFKNSIIISQITRVISLFLTLCYILHFFACFYCYLGFKYTNSWIWQYPELLDNSSFVNVYVSSYYFITETFSSTGYGDLTPINSIEIIFIMFCQILNCGLYAYLLSSILDILVNKENSNSYKYRADQTQFEQWITYYINRLPSSSKMSNLHRHTIWNQSKRFHELYYDNTKNFLWLKDNDFLKQMKPIHRNELLQIAFNNIFTKFQKFFNEIEKLSSKINIVINLKTSIQIQETEILKKGKQIKKIYFIDRGEIDVFYKNKKLNTLKEGDIFGLESLLKNYNNSDIVYKVNVKSKYAILFYIEIGLLIQDILNYDGKSFGNLYKLAETYNYLKHVNELEIVNDINKEKHEEEKREENEEEIKEQNKEQKEEEKDNKVITTSNNNDLNDDSIINKVEKNYNIFNSGILAKLNNNYELLENAKKLIEESDLRIDLIEKQINFLNKYFSKDFN